MIQKKPQTSKSSPSPKDIAQMRRLDAGVMRALNLQAQYEIGTEETAPSPVTAREATQEGNSIQRQAMPEEEEKLQLKLETHSGELASTGARGQGQALFPSKQELGSKKPKKNERSKPVSISHPVSDSSLKVTHDVIQRNEFGIATQKNIEDFINKTSTITKTLK
ncbi:MAG: hypothetical protein F6K42_12425 [Leptolyngbya sp. SIO1D8]|nr:hypothetical protein [Leptolyngbya sp. SIO1D8]